MLFPVYHRWSDNSAMRRMPSFVGCCPMVSLPWCCPADAARGKTRPALCSAPLLELRKAADGATQFALIMISRKVIRNTSMVTSCAAHYPSSIGNWNCNARGRDYSSEATPAPVRWSKHDDTNIERTTLPHDAGHRDTHLIREPQSG